MEFVTLDEFIADLETTFSNYAATNDIDRISVKGWVIDCLRKFGKGICQKNETIVKVENSRALLPEDFRSMILGLRLTTEEELKKSPERRLIVERQWIENPAKWSPITHDYFVNNCESKIVTEKIYTHGETKPCWYHYSFLSVEPAMNKNTVEVNCLNMNPIIRAKYPDKVSITKRTMNTNFKDGKVYIQYTSLPTIDNEIAIPVISTGSLKDYIENEVKIKLSEVLDINEKNSQSLSRWITLWMQQRRQLFIEAKSEVNWNSLNEEQWSRKVHLKNRINAARFNLPK